MAKDAWDKFEIVAKLILTAAIAAIGIHYTTIYQEEQNKINKTKIESEVLRAVMKGGEEQRKIALVLAPFIAERFNDEEFEEMIIEASHYQGNYESVRLLAKEKELERSIDASKEKTKIILQRELDAVSMRRTLLAADNYYKVESFKNAALEYENATEYVPQGISVDLELLRMARLNISEQPELASNQYRRFFAHLREPISPGDKR